MSLLVTGASGRLGRHVLREARRRQLNLTAWSGSFTGELFGYPVTPVRLENLEDFRQRFRALQPSGVLHIAAMANVNECFRDPSLAEQINHQATSAIAELAATHCRFVHVSTDMIFGGDKAPYREHDPVAPLSEYGRSKARAEQALARWPRTCIARMSLLFGPALGDPLMFFDQLVATLRGGQPFSLFVDEYRTPLSLSAAARALCDLVGSDCTGVWNVGGSERVSRYEFGQRLAAYLKVRPELVQRASRLDNAAPEPRPADLSLDSTRFRNQFPGFRSQTLEQAFEELQVPTH